MTNEERASLLAIDVREGDDGDRGRRNEHEGRGRAIAGAFAACLVVGLGVLATMTTTTKDKQRSNALGMTLRNDFYGLNDRKAMTAGMDWMNTPHDWRIVGFANAAYEDVAKLWYYRLQNLGYDYHHIVAVDDEVYDKFSRAGLRVERAPDFTLVKGADLGSFWQFRLRYLLETLKRGQNVLMSDLDVIFAHHYDPNVVFNQVEDENVDVFHSLGTAWPKEAHDKWGFSLCMGFAAFKATPAATALLEAAVHVCEREGDACDDQVVMNDIYLNYLQMSWKPTMKHDQQKGVSHNALIPVTIKTLANLVPRLDMSKLVNSPTRLKPVACYGHVHHVDGGNWAVAPIIEKVGSSKVSTWNRFYDECLVSATVADGTF